MGMVGRKPKPEDQRRNRVKSPHDWVDILNVPYTGPVPRLPTHARPTVGYPVPDPPRPLGRMGRELWGRAHAKAGHTPVDVEGLLILCEQMDERVSTRIYVLENPDDYPAKAALRAVDRQIMSGITSLGLAGVRTVPTTWPAATIQWWDTLSSMPHCVLWTDGDWQFALDTALVAAAFHNGDVRVATELRRRESAMGTTREARRDLRIRYVDVLPETKADTASVTVMDTYRQMARSNAEE